MDFADEPYVRKYTRKTVTSRLLGWEGRMLGDAMLGEFDRSGVFDFRGDIARAISAVTDIPEDLVRIGLARMVETETWIVNDRSITWPTHPEAQHCVRSDRLRQQASRAQRNADSVTNGQAPPSRPVTVGHTPSHAVTNGHAESQAVTDVTGGHAPSRDVTLPDLPSSAPLLPGLPSRAGGDPPSPPPAPAASGGAKPRGERKPEVFHNFDGWVMPPSLPDEARMAGVVDFEGRLARLRNGPIGGKRGVLDRTDYVREQFSHWRTWEETDRAKAAQGVRKTTGTRSPDDRLRELADRREMHLRDEAAAELAANGAHP